MHYSKTTFLFVLLPFFCASALAQSTDIDADTVTDSQDNCVEVYNPTQSDEDYDGIGDACDVIEPDWEYAHTSWALEVPLHNDWGKPYPGNGKNGGARSLSGPHDFDKDGKVEVLLGDYTGGGRVHVIENQGNDNWQIVFSTNVLDYGIGEQCCYAIYQNSRGLGAGDLDGDGLGEFYFLTGYIFSEESGRVPGLYIWEATGADNSFSAEPVSVWDFNGEVPDRSFVEKYTIADVDGDGKNELIFGNNGLDNARDEWWVLEVTGDIGSGTESFEVDARFSSRSTVYDENFRGGGSPYGSSIGDFDGDGNLDIALQSWNDLNFSNVTTSGPNTYVSPDPSSPLAYFHATPGQDLVSLFGCREADINADGDDELFCPVFQSGNVAIMNYEAGESVLEVGPDQVIPNFLEGLATFDMAIGDINQDGRVDLLGSGKKTFRASSFAAGDWQGWIVSKTFGGNGSEGLNPELSSNYVDMNIFDFSSERSPLRFDKVYCVDGSGLVYNEFYDDGPRGPLFVSRFAYLGDADGDGNEEVAASFQGVEDYFHVYEEFGACEPGRFNQRRLIGKHPNPRRTFMRIFEVPAQGIPTKMPDQNSNLVPDLLESEQKKLTALAGLLEDPNSQRAVRDVFEALENASGSDFWRDAVTLDPQFGHKVYSKLKEAVDVIMNLEGESTEADALAQRIASEIVQVLAVVSETAVDELSAVCDTGRKCMRSMQRAASALEIAGILEANLNWSHAIDRYRQAWREATDELQRSLSKRGMEEYGMRQVDLLPKEVSLSNYPNPFNPVTTITFALPESQRVLLRVFDIMGRQVKELANGTYDAGHHSVTFDASSLPSGSYIYRLQVGEKSISRQMILSK